MLKIIFSISGLFFILLIIFHKLFAMKIKNMMLKSHLIALMTLFLGAYIISGIILAIVIPNILNKSLMLLFSLSPFIIGKIATYQKEKLYTLIQIFCVLMSIGFILIRGY